MLGVLVYRDVNNISSVFSSFVTFFLAYFACSIAFHPLYNFGGQSGTEPDLQDR